MITLKQAQPRDQELLWNLLQKYLYEMTAYYPDKMEPDGTYPYRYFDAYFTEPERRSYLIYEDTELVGFAMTNPYPYITEQTEHVIAEFTIFPSFRGRHLALRAAQKILDDCPGNWEIKFHGSNTGARRLWETLTAPYHPTVHLMGDETVLEFSNRQKEEMT